MRIRVRRRDPYTTRFRVGDEFVVTAVRAPRDGPAYFHVHDPHRPPSAAAVRSVDLDLMAGTIPSNWRVRIDDEGNVDFGPPGWSSPLFWRDLYEADEAARAAYERELAAILAES